MREVRVTETLRDGSPVEIRRLRASDAPVLARRVRAPQRGVAPAALHLAEAAPERGSSCGYLTDVDGHRHEALAASDARTGAGIGVARFVRLEDEPEVAEVAVTVVDEWQHRGLGTLLLEAARRTRRASEGITHFSALVSSDDRSMLEHAAPLRR